MALYEPGHCHATREFPTLTKAMWLFLVCNGVCLLVSSSSVPFFFFFFFVFVFCDTQIPRSAGLLGLAIVYSRHTGFLRRSRINLFLESPHSCVVPHLPRNRQLGKRASLSTSDWMRTVYAGVEEGMIEVLRRVSRPTATGDPGMYVVDGVNRLSTV